MVTKVRKWTSPVCRGGRSQLDVKTLRTQVTSDPTHFGTIRLVPKCPDSSAPVPKCLADTSALVPNCLDLQQTFFATTGHTEKGLILLVFIIKMGPLIFTLYTRRHHRRLAIYSHTVNDILNYKSK